jgi:hypothetical protein
MADKQEQETKEDPYVVKQQVPSFAKEENQWELDMKAAAEAGDASKKLVAITTGAFAMVISLLYLIAVFALESRGEMKVCRTLLASRLGLVDVPFLTSCPSPH